MRRDVNLDRIAAIKALYESGLTLQQIGDAQEPKITRERVRQILAMTDYVKVRRASVDTIKKQEHASKRRQLKALLSERWDREEVLKITGWFAFAGTDEDLCDMLRKSFNICKYRDYLNCNLCHRAQKLEMFPPSASRSHNRVCTACNTNRCLKYWDSLRKTHGQSLNKILKSRLTPEQLERRRVLRNAASIRYQKKKVAERMASPDYVPFDRAAHMRKLNQIRLEKMRKQ